MTITEVNTNELGFARLATKREYAEAQQLFDTMRAVGLNAMYGGGRKAKGHGFWIEGAYRNDYLSGGNTNDRFWLPEDIRRLLADRFGK